MGVSYIWRDNASRASSTDKISFETGTVTDDQGHIHQCEFKIITAIAENEKPNAKLNELQDTQVDSVTVTITGSIHNWQTAGASGTASTIPQTVKEWMCDKKTSTSFTKGRFGIELDDFGTFDCNPNNSSGTERGYILQDWTWSRDGDTQGKTSFIATFKLNGYIGAENSTYSWT